MRVDLRPRFGRVRKEIIKMVKDGLRSGLGPWGTRIRCLMQCREAGDPAAMDKKKKKFGEAEGIIRGANVRGKKATVEGIGPEHRNSNEKSGEQ